MFLKQGEAADCFYIVESGVVKITIRRKVNHNMSIGEVRKAENTVNHITHFTHY